MLLGIMTLTITAAILKPEPAVKAMDTAFKNSVWNQRGNFESRGVLIHIVQESIRHQARSASPPSELEVEEALAVLQSVRAGREAPAEPQRLGGQPRNVHMLVLESFWDAALLTGSGLSEDPLDPEFRRLWQAAGNSHVLSPVFGGYTANPEFEVLCGLPVTENFVFFEAGLRNTVACLPQVLQLLRRRLQDLRLHRLPAEALLVSQKLSRELEKYRSPSPAARAAAQLRQVGKPLGPGQLVRFIYMRGWPGVHAWDLPEPPNLQAVDVQRYRTLLLRAASSITHQPLGLSEAVLTQWLNAAAAGVTLQLAY